MNLSSRKMSRSELAKNQESLKERLSIITKIGTKSQKKMAIAIHDAGYDVSSQDFDMLMSTASGTYYEAILSQMGLSVEDMESAIGNAIAAFLYPFTEAFPDADAFAKIVMKGAAEAAENREFTNAK